MARPGSHILVVDDVASNRLLAKSLLERLGHSVSTADDGLKALDELAAARFDAVLMDWDMPRLDGIAAAREYYRRCAEADVDPVPIILMTAHVSDTARNKSAEAGLAGFLPKPVTPNSIRSCLARWIPASDDRPASGGLAVGTGEIGPHEIATAGIGAREIGASEVGAGEVGANGKPAEEIVRAIEALPLVRHSTVHRLIEDLESSSHVVTFIDIFVSESQARRDVVQHATPTTCVDAHRACHTLKSSAAMLGASRLASAASSFEERFRTNDLPATSEREWFDQVTQDTIDELRAFRNELAE